eukprot:scaffold527_cov368-Prasinococcus_capsulatus_cf.AAC.32
MGRTRALAATLLATLAVLLQTASADYYDEYNDSKGLSGTDFDAVLGMSPVRCVAPTGVGRSLIAMLCAAPLVPRERGRTWHSQEDP